MQKKGFTKNSTFFSKLCAGRENKTNKMVGECNDAVGQGIIHMNSCYIIRAILNFLCVHYRLRILRSFVAKYIDASKVLNELMNSCSKHFPHDREIIQTKKETG